MPLDSSFRESCTVVMISGMNLRVAMHIVDSAYINSVCIAIVEATSDREGEVSKRIYDGTSLFSTRRRGRETVRVGYSEDM